MKKLLSTALITLVATTAQAATLRCENGIADRGDNTAEVLRKCGAPASQAVTGYTLDDKGNRKFRKEEWVYSSKTGMLYFVQFVGERVTQVTSRRSE